MRGRRGQGSLPSPQESPAVPRSVPRCARPARPNGQASPKELLCTAGASSFTPPLVTKRLSITHNTLSQKV